MDTNRFKKISEFHKSASKEAGEVDIMIDPLTKESGIDRWFKEKWVDISKKDKSGKHPPCGRKDADKGKYPKCRPSKRVSSKTPKTTKELSSKEKKKAVKQKRKTEKKRNKPAGGGARKPKRAPNLKRKKSSAEVCLIKLSFWLQKNGFEKEYNELIALSRYNMSKKRR